MGIIADMLAGGASSVAGYAGRLAGDFKGQNPLTKAYHGSKKVLKIAAIGAAAAAGLAYIASAGRKPVTEADVSDMPLSPEDIGALTPVVPEGAAMLPPMEMAAAEESTRWRDTVRGEGPQQLASAPIPSIAEEGGYQDVVTKRSESSNASLAV